jgi:hypothetical protein
VQQIRSIGGDEPFWSGGADVAEKSKYGLRCRVQPFRGMAAYEQFQSMEDSGARSSLGGCVALGHFEVWEGVDWFR